MSVHFFLTKSNILVGYITKYVFNMSIYQWYLRNVGWKPTIFLTRSIFWRIAKCLTEGWQWHQERREIAAVQ